MATIGTYNEEGTNVDLYIPRKCHATNTLITSYDHSAVQIPIANVNARGVADGKTTTFCIAGYLRAQGESDHAINHLAIERGIMRIKSRKPKRTGEAKKALRLKLAARRHGGKTAGAAAAGAQGKGGKAGAAGAGAAAATKRAGAAGQKTGTGKGGRSSGSAAQRASKLQKQSQRGGARGGQRGGARAPGASRGARPQGGPSRANRPQASKAQQPTRRPRA